MSSADTIFALATMPGKSGVAVIRLSGCRAAAALQTITGLDSLLPRHAYYTAFRSPLDENIIDCGLALYFAAPHSFTGEDVTEFHIHGSPAVIRELLDLLAALEGLRPAEPGEFTRRAFINGKMDLVEAEGLADLIDSETRQQKAQAMRQMQGELSRYFGDIRRRIVECLAHLEAYIDFPDEEIPESVWIGLSGEIRQLQAIIESALSDRQRGERLRDGINVVILGAPNVGKSSLLNTIARRDAAIVSARAGTTRDIIETHLDLSGYPVVLVDTAGLRETADDIEEEGVRRALARAASADIRLVLFDSGTWPVCDAQSLALLGEGTIAVVSKSDLLSDTSSLLFPRRRESSSDTGDELNPIFISTKTGQGLEALLLEIERHIISFFSSDSAPLITRSRHHALLGEALKSLEKSLMDKPLELKCEELRLAALSLGKITGKIQVDELLEVIFSQFCIGK